MFSKRNGIRTVIALCLGSGLVATKGLAQPQNITQTPLPTFEAASVKPNNHGGGPYPRLRPGRLVMTYFSVRDLIAFAYGVRTDQIPEGAPWIVSDHYDIEATAEGNTSVNQMGGAMLQALLEDRFKLKLHRETRQLPVYELTVLKGGVKLQPTKAGSCTPFSPNSPPASATVPGTPRLPFCGYPRSGADGLNWTLEGEGISIEALAGSLSRLELRRSVIDKTGLTGSYDVHLKWTLDPLAPAASDSPGVPPAPDGPSIFTSLREQLGLRLESAKGPVEVLVIDHVEKPSEN